MKRPLGVEQSWMESLRSCLLNSALKRMKGMLDIGMYRVKIIIMNSDETAGFDVRLWALDFGAKNKASKIARPQISTRSSIKCTLEFIECGSQ